MKKIGFEGKKSFFNENGEFMTPQRRSSREINAANVP